MKDISQLSDAELEQIAYGNSKANSNKPSFAKLLGVGARGAVKGIGAIPDLLALPSNIALMATNQSTLPSISEALGSGFDYLTNDQFQPEGLGEKALGSAAEFISGGGGIAKAGATAGSKFARKYLAPKTAKQFASLGTAGAGMEVGKEYFPETPYSPLIGSVLGGFIPSVTHAGIKGATFPFKSKSTSQKLPSDQQQAVDLSRKFKVPISPGQASQNLSQQIVEDLLAGGAKGAPAANIINTFRNQQQEAFQSAVRNTRKDIGKGEFVERGKSLKPAIEKIIDTAKSEKKVINTAYDIAKENISFLNIKDIKEFPKIVRNQFVEEALAPENAPAAYNQLKSFDNLFLKAPSNSLAVSFKRLEAWRQGLNKSYAASMGQDKHGIDLIRKQFDNYLDNTIEKALVEGNSAVLEQFKKARKLYTEWQSKYTARNKNEFGKKFIQDIIKNAQESREPYTYRMISDKIFSANKYGFKPQAVNIINEIKKHVNPESPEFHGLKLDAVQKVVKPLLNNKGRFNFNNAAIQTFKNNLDDNKDILKSILNDSELEQLKDLGDLGTLLFQSKKSITNPPQSGLVNILSKLPIVKQALGIADYVPYIQDIRSASTAKQIINPESLEKNLGKLNAKGKDGSFLATSLLKPLSESINNNAVNNDDIKTLATSLLKLLSESINNDVVNNDDIKTLSDEELEQVIQQNNAQSPQEDNKEDLIDKIAYIESGNNPNAKSSTSSASGLLQFTNPTWKDAVSKYGKDYGIQASDKNNPEAQKVIASLMLKENANELTKYLGRKPNTTEIYLTHFLGLEGAKKFLNNYGNNIIAARILPAAAKANRNIFFKGNKPRSTQEVYELINQKLSMA